MTNLSIPFNEISQNRMLHKFGPVDRIKEDYKTTCGWDQSACPITYQGPQIEWCEDIQKGMSPVNRCTETVKVVYETLEISSSNESEYLLISRVIILRVAYDSEHVSIHLSASYSWFFLRDHVVCGCFNVGPSSLTDLFGLNVNSRIIWEDWRHIIELHFSVSCLYNAYSARLNEVDERVDENTLECLNLLLSLL